MKKILLAGMMALGVATSAQISYNYGWEPTGLGSWTISGSGLFDRSTTTPCAGSGSIRANNYYASTSYLTSPALLGTNGGDLSVSFSYKVTKYSDNSTGATLADVGAIRVQYATSASGPWITTYTIQGSGTHTVSASCAAKSINISGLPTSGNVYVRFAVTAGSSADNYVYFDDISVTQATLATFEASKTKNNTKVYPNPFTDTIAISNGADVKSILVADVSGRIVKTVNEIGTAVHLEDLKSGIYFMTLMMKDGSKQTIKMVKK
ncbi:T9SS type A sorting domain-containing protein [Chryseobacterium sp. 3008163]|uniref:T9SS type A sorting domain-containing protein n=1 Tax=Chryseobacterium sp. 3008163 TaxID=2478663 RepID=UPI000F0D1784|nr:T9SS type A sorting domain-containing protein [Chryseobacterium sp. 3008163]AYN00611.1 T9SS C-terminal target domain-containing protein [Chryseobacterium sp. 3008163]